MSELIRVLVISKNETLKRNMEEWFRTKIETGKLMIDFASSRDDAEKFMSAVDYDKIFHNGIYVIPAIERLQAGSDVYMFGKTNNNLNNYVENPHDKKKISRIFDRKYLKTMYNIGGLLGSVITIVIALVIFIAFNIDTRAETRNNTKSTKENKQEIREVKKEVNRVGDISEENNIILKIVYGDEIEALLKKNKSTIGDDDG